VHEEGKKRGEIRKKRRREGRKVAEGYIAALNSLS